MVARRQVLQGAAVSVVGLAVLTGCSDDESRPPEQPVPDAQQSDEALLVALYDAALSAAGEAQRALLQRIRDEHAAHLTALGWQGALPALPSTQGPFTRRQLLLAERRALRLRTAGARDAQDGGQAQVLALIAASEAQHIADLGSL